MNGYPRPDAPVAGAGYHPNAAGMTAVADALDKLLWAINAEGPDHALNVEFASAAMQALRLS
jgi:hypothetical protein